MFKFTQHSVYKKKSNVKLKSIQNPRPKIPYIKHITLYKHVDWPLNNLAG